MQKNLQQSLSCLPPKQSLRLLVLSLTLQLRSYLPLMLSWTLLGLSLKLRSQTS